MQLGNKGIAVYRAEDGGKSEQIMQGQLSTLMSGPFMALVANAGCYATVDDVSFTAIEPGEYFAMYNDANDDRVRTSCISARGPAGTLNRVPEGKRTERVEWNADHEGRVAYTYDDWGRTVTKSRAVDASTTHVAICLSMFRKTETSGDAAERATRPRMATATSCAITRKKGDSNVLL